MSNFELNQMILDLELRSLLDINDWRELSDFEKERLTIKEQNNLLGLCPKDFTIDNLENALLEKTKIEKLITIELV